MSDDEVARLKLCLETAQITGMQLCFRDTMEGVLVPIRIITDNYRMTDDPAEILESAAWLANHPAKCIGLLGASIDEFVLISMMPIASDENV